MTKYFVEFSFMLNEENKWDVNTNKWQRLIDNLSTEELSSYRNDLHKIGLLQNPESDFHSIEFAQAGAVQESRDMKFGTRIRVIDDENNIFHLYIAPEIDIMKPDQKWIIDLMYFYGLTEIEIIKSVSEFVKYWVKPN